MIRQLLRPLTTGQIVVDVVLAAGFFLLFGFVTLAPERPWILAVVTSLFMSGALAVRRLSPALALAIAWVGAIVQMASLLSPLPSNLAIFGVLYVTAAYGSRFVMWTGFASAIAGAITITGYLLFMPGAFGGPNAFTSPLAAAVMSGSILAAALFSLLLSWTAGALVRASIRARENREAQRRAELEAASEQERGRIARDMHDVVAHSLAVVVAQADGARYAAASDPAVAAEALRTISQTARAALSDVRMLLTQLRHREAEGPQPTLADLEQLFAQVRAAGIEIGVDIDPAPPADVPASVQLAVYRILQEALTNALRHGDRAGVDVRLSWWPDRVAFRVTNGIAPVAPDRADGTPGHGLIGIRERAQLVGGRVDAGAQGSTFVVAGELPIGGSA
ncbi:sensor histidine kinase [Microbacterium sp. Marseille-Q6965]|uniref:sensor histidine kinase n=1 Tax=Microbacterium sp. Marseille-Q6965 TaxID=2965072 RepID=UPI0021B7A19C|nr:histidine kinase [Microbacterium sp. Marseille-Q6965]